jgi:chemotaxis response regulator CheB
MIGDRWSGISGHNRSWLLERGLISVAWVRVLLVGHFKAWRTYVRDLVQEPPRLEVVGAAVGGRPAIEKGESLQPDLTWLDVGMPRMHGIEAAQRMRETVLDGEILFLSVERSPEFDQVALGTGAQEAQAR